MKNRGVAFFLSFSFFFAVQELAIAATLTFTNNCSYAVWPGILAYDQSIRLSTTGFELAIGASKSVSIPSPWSGRIWARTGCSNDSGIFVCVTGDCGSGQVECNGAGASLPATTAELTTASNSGDEFYHVSNADGFNLPMSIAPEGGNGSCKSSNCPVNITSICPEELQVRWSDGNVIACKSACLALNQSEYCCTGNFNGADKCQPTRYSQFFERQCPDAYSYAGDDTRLNSNFTCSAGSDYTVTFCPLRPKGEAHGAIITFTNNCSETVWPALVTTNSATGQQDLLTTGLELKKGTSSFVDIPYPWTGRFWARTRCASSSGNFTCATGDCGSGQLGCNGLGASGPATLVELTKASSSGQDFYDVSYVDGFNLPISIAPKGGNGDCKPASCLANLTSSCPSDLQLRGSDGNIIACMSACTAFRQPQYCCTGDFGTPGNCTPTSYSQFFKKQCPDAYSYPYDDKTGTFTCSGGPNYIVTFCP